MKTGFEAFGSTQIYLQDYVNNEENTFPVFNKAKGIHCICIYEDIRKKRHDGSQKTLPSIALKTKEFKEGTERAVTPGT